MTENALDSLSWCEDILQLVITVSIDSKFSGQSTQDFPISIISDFYVIDQERVSIKTENFTAPIADHEYPEELQIVGIKISQTGVLEIIFSHPMLINMTIRRLRAGKVSI